MPRVPIYSAPQVAQRAAPTVLEQRGPAATPVAPFQNFDTRGTRGEQMADAIAGGTKALGGAVAGIGDALAKEKAKADNTATLQGIADLNTGLTDIYHNPETGFRQQLGADAAKNSGEYKSRAEKLRDDIAARLGNDQQREAFLLHSNGPLLSTQTAIEDHVSQQNDVVHEMAYKSAVASSVQAIGANWQSDDAFQTQLQALKLPVLAEISRRGIPRNGAADAPAQKYWEDIKRQAVEARLMGAITSRTPGAETKAAEILDANSELLGPRAEVFREKVDAMVDATGVAQSSTSVLEKSTNPQSGWANVVEARRLVDALPETNDSEVKHKERVRQLVEFKLAKNEDVRKDATEATMAKAFAILGTNGRNLNDPALAPLRAWAMNPENRAAETWLKMEQGVDAQFRARRSDNAAANRDQAQANKAAVEAYGAIPLVDRPAVRIDSTFPAADKPTRDHLRGLQNDDVKKTSGGGIAKENAVREMFSAALQGRMRTNPPSAAKADKDQVNSFATTWHDSWLKTHKGQDPTREDVASEVAKQTQAGKTEGVFGFLFGGKDTVRILAPKGKDFRPADDPAGPVATPSAPRPAPAARMADLAADDVRRAKAALQKRGVTPTDAAVLQLVNKARGN